MCSSDLEMVEAPDSYVYPSSLTRLSELLDAHGVAYHILPGDVAATVERFRIDSTTVATREFQGVAERTLHGVLEREDDVVPAGYIRVPVGQPLGRLVSYLLEARSDDGIVNWAIIDDVVADASHYPVWRLVRR